VGSALRARLVEQSGWSSTREETSKPRVILCGLSCCCDRAVPVNLARRTRSSQRGRCIRQDPGAESSTAAERHALRCTYLGTRTILLRIRLFSAVSCSMSSGLVMQPFTMLSGDVGGDFEQTFRAAAVLNGITTSLARYCGSVPLIYRPDSGIPRAGILDLPHIGRS
jgi:hypothetical protein